jgi:hypothetical protein
MVPRHPLLIPCTCHHAADGTAVPRHQQPSLAATHTLSKTDRHQAACRLQRHLQSAQHTIGSRQHQ